MLLAWWKLVAEDLHEMHMKIYFILLHLRFIDFLFQLIFSFDIFTAVLVLHPNT